VAAPQSLSRRSSCFIHTAHLQSHSQQHKHTHTHTNACRCLQGRLQVPVLP
jgi:hypothetical protein